ncbi:glycoside hydrolase N-terminal domain-containing protein [Streptomyces sp. NPDC006617]|uniref:glycosyl hydrolase family 95 catalytic domain-containing protein n=1 Tax=Streptomyces sp. NPDC006617 TaxID=3155354 RepID=UPI0033B3E7F3
MSRIPNRRTILGLGGAAVLTALPAFTAHAAPHRPAGTPLVPAVDATTLWYPEPADADTLIEEGLPLGNGRLGALVGGDPAAELLHVTDATLWTGDANIILDADGQFPYERTHFGSFTLLARVTLALPGHERTAVNAYRRTLDLSNGLVTTSYKKGRATYRREMFASEQDDVIVVRLTQRGGGSLTGSVILSGTHGETTSAHHAGGPGASFTAALGNGLRYAAAVTAVSDSGHVSVDGPRITFTNCADLTVIISGGTNYAPDHAAGYRDPGVDPHALAVTKATGAARVPATRLRDTHVADYRQRYDRFTLSLGSSTPCQRRLDTWSRLKTRAAVHTVPDPELEVSYLQYGRYLTICGSRSGLPMGLQGLWLEGNTPDWMGDYHTDVNVQMNYWLPDRAGLNDSFTALADYCIAQLPGWTTVTQHSFNDPRNRYRNTSGQVAGWTVAYSTNIYGGMGWWWHPAGNAWLCESLYEHYEFTQDESYLRRIHPLLKGACEFWEAGP